MRLGISSYTFGFAVGADGSRPVNALTAIGLVDRAKQMGVGVLQIADNMPARPTHRPRSMRSQRTLHDRPLPSN